MGLHGGEGLALRADLHVSNRSLMCSLLPQAPCTLQRGEYRFPTTFPCHAKVQASRIPIREGRDVSTLRQRQQGECWPAGAVEPPVSSQWWVYPYCGAAFLGLDNLKLALATDEFPFRRLLRAEVECHALWVCCPCYSPVRLQPLKYSYSIVHTCGCAFLSGALKELQVPLHVLEAIPSQFSSNKQVA